jgi:hypothetical protein
VRRVNRVRPSDRWFRCHHTPHPGSTSTPRSDPVSLECARWGCSLGGKVNRIRSGVSAGLRPTTERRVFYFPSNKDDNGNPSPPPFNDANQTGQRGFPWEKPRYDEFERRMEVENGLTAIPALATHHSRISLHALKLKPASYFEGGEEHPSVGSRYLSMRTRERAPRKDG